MLITERGLKGNYKLAEVVETFPGPDGKVRKVSLRYKNFKPGESASVYKGALDTVVIRAVQRLALIVPSESDKQ